MTILYVDTEHNRVAGHPERGPSHRAKVERTRERVAAAAGMPCAALPFAEIDPERLGRLAPAAVVIGGNTTEWAAFADETLAGLLATIRAAPVPILGICAGHQLIGFAHGAPWGPLGALAPGEVDPDPRFAPGQRKQRGFLPVEIDPDCPLFHGLDETAAFFQSHSWQLEGIPAGFVARAASTRSPIQAIERVDRPVFGVQFHPERADAAHPAGAAVLRTFFALARETALTPQPPFPSAGEGETHRIP